jgi:hypothetical protein
MSVFDFGKRAARRKRKAARQKALQERRSFEHELDAVFADMRAEIKGLQTELTWKPVEAKTSRLRTVRYLSALASLWIPNPLKPAAQRALAGGRSPKPADLQPGVRYSEPA